MTIATKGERTWLNLLYQLDDGWPGRLTDDDQEDYWAPRSGRRDEPDQKGD